MVRGLTRNHAETRADTSDPALRARVYAVPFARVWETALDVADEMGWTVVHADEQEGRLRAEARTRVFRFVDDVEVRLSLDADAQTRVHARSASRVGRGDLGTNRRRIGRFMRTLDRRLQATS